jgi:hypothetical protein
VKTRKDFDMPLYLQTNKCLNLHPDDKRGRFDPINSDSKFPSLFCSLRCEREWLAQWVANLAPGQNIPDKGTHPA